MTISVLVKITKNFKNSTYYYTYQLPSTEYDSIRHFTLNFIYDFRNYLPEEQNKADIKKFRPRITILDNKGREHPIYVSAIPSTPFDNTLHWIYGISYDELRLLLNKFGTYITVDELLNWLTIVIQDTIFRSIFKDTKGGEKDA